MNTSNASSFFQSADAQANIARQAAKTSNKLGGPIHLQTKLLDIAPDLEDPRYVLIAESGSISRRINIETGGTQAIYRGHVAPVTSIVHLNNKRIATGSWDKTIRVYDKIVNTHSSNTTEG